jgi:hypothetical protein
MNNLINKAIQAIKDNKTEYAIGLLEGILEMNSSEVKVASTVPILGNVVGSHPVVNDPERAILEAKTISSLDEIKRIANEGLNV